VVLASKNSETQPVFEGLQAAAAHPNTDFKIFGKPSTRPYRRMAVALSYGEEDVEVLVEKAKAVAACIQVQ
jgi:phosphoribosylglycinamide formyltransferase 2